MKTEQINTLKEKLKAHLDFSERNGENMDSASWGYEEGMIITGNEAMLFLELLNEKYKDKHGKV